MVSQKPAPMAKVVAMAPQPGAAMHADDDRKRALAVRPVQLAQKRRVGGAAEADFLGAHNHTNFSDGFFFRLHP